MEQASRPFADLQNSLGVDCDNHTYKCRNFFPYLQLLTAMAKMSIDPLDVEAEIKLGARP